MKSCWAFIQTNGVRWLKNLSVIKKPLHGQGRLRRGFAWMVYAPKQVNMIIR